MKAHGFQSAACAQLGIYDPFDSPTHRLTQGLKSKRLTSTAKIANGGFGVKLFARRSVLFSGETRVGTVFFPVPTAGFGHRF